MKSLPAPLEKVPVSSATRLRIWLSPCLMSPLTLRSDADAGAAVATRAHRRCVRAQAREQIQGEEGSKFSLTHDLACNSRSSSAYVL